MSDRKALVDGLNALDWDHPYTMGCQLKRLTDECQCTAGDIYTVTQHSTAAWWHSRWSLHKLLPEIGKALDEKGLPLQYAQELTRFEHDVQYELAAQVPQDFDPVGFAKLCLGRWKEIRASQRAAREEELAKNPLVLSIQVATIDAVTRESLGQGTALIYADDPLSQEPEPLEIEQAYQARINDDHAVFHKVIGIKRHVPAPAKPELKLV